MSNPFRRYAPFQPILINVVSGIQSANPERDLSVLLGYLDVRARCERNEITVRELRLACPPSSIINPCVGFVLPVVAERIVQQPEVRRAPEAFRSATR